MLSHLHDRSIPYIKIGDAKGEGAARTSEAKGVRNKEPEEGVGRKGPPPRRQRDAHQRARDHSGNS